MFKRVLLAGLAFCAISAQAFQVSFTDTQFDVTAIALSDGAPDLQSATSLTDPATASAASIGINVATAGSFAGLDFLTASADVSGVNGDLVSAVATSRFLGSFVSGAELLLDIDFMTSDFMSGSGIGGTTLFMTLMSGTTTLFSDYLSGSQLFSYAVAAGSTGTLELTLSSEAAAGLLASSAGGYSSTGFVSITTPVPEPQTYVLFALGLAVLAVAVRRRA